MHCTHTSHLHTRKLLPACGACQSKIGFPGLCTHHHTSHTCITLTPQCSHCISSLTHPCSSDGGVSDLGFVSQSHSVFAFRMSCECPSCVRVSVFAFSRLLKCE